MKYIVSESQIEDFLSKALDIKDSNQKHVYLGVMELAKDLLSTQLSKEMLIDLCSQHDDEDILYMVHRLKEKLFSNGRKLC